jgi:cobalt-zinc-cadmium efflux system protein
MLVLRGGAKDSINMRGAYLEVLGDLFGSIAAIVASVIILTTGFARADAIASLVIAALIVPRAIGLLRDVFHVLSESTPRGTDVEQIRRHIVETDGVVDVHDVHVWQITSGAPVFSAHVVVDAQLFASGGTGALLDRLSGCLAEHFDVEHSTFQLEPSEHAAHEEQFHR